MSSSLPATSHASHLAQRALAVFVGLHGLAHLAGTSDAVTRAADGDSVTWLAGSWELSDPTTLRLFSAAWALLAVAFLAVALKIWRRDARWPLLLGATTSASLVLVAVALWASVVGLVINLALLGIAAAATRGSTPRGAPHAQAP